MEYEITQIIKYANLFRNSIEQNKDNLSISLKNFPKGACGAASELFGTFLKEKGFGDFNYICGGRINDGYSHAWLEKNGLIIDITADQFENQSCKVIVTYDSKWHFENFVICEKPHPADFKTYYYYPLELIQDYEFLQKYISEVK